MKGIRHLFTLALVLSALAAPTLSFAVSTIVIDAGHGGVDRGGQPGQRATEKNYTLAVAQRLAPKLRAAGFRVVMTRTGDYFVGLQQRCNIANGQRDAAFLSVHFNAAPRVGASGVETYYYSSRSRSFAEAVHREVLRVMRTENRGVRQRGFYVIRRTSCPSVLIESGFLTNPAELRRLNSSSFQDELAGAMARAVISRYK